MSKSQKNTTTIKVRFSRNKQYYYVAESLISLLVGWLSVEKKEPTEEEKEKIKNKFGGSGVMFDDGEYFRERLDFRFWKVKSNKKTEEISIHDELVKDYIDAALQEGWHPRVDDKNLREDQREEEKQLDAKIQAAYGYER